MKTGERAEPASVATCIVWRPSGVALPPQPLLQALAARGLRGMHCDNPYDAFARLCSAVRRARSDPHRVSLLLVDRGQLAGVDAVLDALETYTPSVVVWEYDEQHGLQPQRADEPQSIDPPPQVQSVPRRAAAPVQPPLRLSGLGQGDAAVDNEPTPSQILTDEELAMLLDDEPPAEDES